MVENNMSRYARHAVCPHCGGDLEIQMQVEISEVAIPAVTARSAVLCRRT
jgi:hypothetical protein